MLTEATYQDGQPPPSGARRPLRILYCETNVDGTIGGSYYSLLFLIQGLDRHRYEPLVMFYTENSLLDAFRRAGARVFIWPKRPCFTFGQQPPPRIRRFSTVLLAVQKVLNLICAFVVPMLERALFLWREQVDIVHLNNSVLHNHDWMAAAKLTATWCVSHERGINERYTAAARFWAGRIDAIVCISDAVKTALVSAGVNVSNLTIIHNGLAASEVAPTADAATVRASLSIPTDADVVLMVGNLKAWKGQEVLVRAMDLVRRSRPAARCVLVGATAPADVDYERALRALVSRLGLEDHVVFAGYRRDTSNLMTIADLVVHASIKPEPFGRVLLEAMACRKPIVASKGGAVSEVVTDRRTGVLCEPGDHEAFAHAIVGLLSNPDDARQMGEAGYQRLVEQFSIDRNVRATEQLYDRMVGATA